MLNPYLCFNRECAEALTLYGKAFGAKALTMQKYGEMPPDPNFPVDEADKDLVLHAMADILGTTVMCSDNLIEFPKGGIVFLSVSMDDIEAGQKAWNLLADGGEVRMDLQPTFFAKAHGSLVDKFGVGWMFTVR
jgi:PhnB protein